MKIKLISREIELFKVGENASKLDARLTGTVIYKENRIYFDGENPFHTCLHEIYHFYIKRIGFNQLEEFSREVICDMFGTCIEQLMLENGNDIFIKLKQFAEEK